jgi:hypothetical protein
VAVKVKPKEVLPIQELAALELHGQFLPGHHIALQKNSVCSAWVDVEDLVKAQDVDAYDADGNPAHELFIDYMNEARLAQSIIGKYKKYVI